MENTAIFNQLVNGYHKSSATDKYMFGFIDRHNVWLAYATAEVLPYVTTLDKASRGAGYTLRFKPNKAQKEFLKTMEVEVLCSEKFFNDYHSRMGKYNKGEVFEKMVTEKFGQKWAKDSTPYYMDGDLTVNGEKWQIKFESATFTNESTLSKVPAEYRNQQA